MAGFELAQFLLVAFSFAALTWAYVVSDFSVQNVFENSHSMKPMIYKISGVWGNHEGSMMLWLLTLALFSAEAERVRRCFILLRELRDRLRQSAPVGIELDALSMGMSGDFEIAIEEGATVVRVGQAISPDVFDDLSDEQLERLVPKAYREFFPG